MPSLPPYTTDWIVRITCLQKPFEGYMKVDWGLHEFQGSPTVSSPAPWLLRSSNISKSDLQFLKGKFPFCNVWAICWCTWKPNTCSFLMELGSLNIFALFLDTKLCVTISLNFSKEKRNLHSSFLHPLTTALATLCHSHLAVPQSQIIIRTLWHSEVEWVGK